MGQGEAAHRLNRAVGHTIIGTPKTEQSQRFFTVTDELRAILLALWNAKGSPLGGYILAGPEGRPIILDNLAKRSIRTRLEEVNKKENSNLSWPGWYALRRFVGTEVRMQADIETSAKTLSNSKAVADKHDIKSTTTLPDVRKAVNSALSRLVQ